MYALYYKHPESGVMYPCISTRLMCFSIDTEVEPVLLAKAANVEKVLRGYKNSVKHYHDTGYDHYLARFIHSRYPMVDVTTLDNFVIVPMDVTPKFDNGYVYKK